MHDGLGSQFADVRKDCLWRPLGWRSSYLVRPARPWQRELGSVKRNRIYLNSGALSTSATSTRLKWVGCHDAHLSVGPTAEPNEVWADASTF